MYQVTAADDATPEFSPQVSATCKTGVMNIKVAFNGSYNGAIHARDFRTSSCMQFGDGSSNVALSLNLLAREGHSDYCGILVHNVSGDVRMQHLLTNLTIFFALLFFRFCPCPLYLISNKSFFLISYENLQLIPFFIINKKHLNKII